MHSICYAYAMLIRGLWYAYTYGGEGAGKAAGGRTKKSRREEKKKEEEKELRLKETRACVGLWAVFDAPGCEASGRAPGAL